VASRYCEENKVGGWKSTLKTLQRETTMDFFLFVCGNYNIKSWGTSHVYIRQFQQLYTTVTGRFMDRNDAKEVYKVCSCQRHLDWGRALTKLSASTIVRS
jgi:hypothetical protein